MSLLEKKFCRTRLEHVQVSVTIGKLDWEQDFEEQLQEHIQEQQQHQEPDQCLRQQHRQEPQHQIREEQHPTNHLVDDRPFDLIIGAGVAFVMFLSVFY